MWASWFLTFDSCLCMGWQPGKVTLQRQPGRKHQSAWALCRERRTQHRHGHAWSHTSVQGWLSRASQAPGRLRRATAWPWLHGPPRGVLLSSEQAPRSAITRQEKSGCAVLLPPFIRLETVSLQAQAQASLPLARRSRVKAQ